MKVAASNVWQILKDAGIDPAPDRASSTWADFLRSQAGALLACDFFEAVTLGGTRMYVLAVIEHHSRRIRVLGALAHVRTALEAADRITADEHLRRALLRFKELDRTHEARLDARAHAAALDAVLAFAELEHAPPASIPAAQRLADAARQLDATAAQLAAWTRGMHQLDWLSARSLT